MTTANLSSPDKTLNNPTYQAYQIYTLVLRPPHPLWSRQIFELDGGLVHLSRPFVDNIIPANIFMPIVGIVEIIAGLLVFFKPRIGAYVVAALAVGHHHQPIVGTWL